METFRIILYIIIAVVIILMIYAVIYNKIKTLILKINSAENEIDDSLRIKYDLITKLIIIVKQIEKESLILDNIDNLKDENISSFEFERKLIDYEIKLYDFKDNSKLSKDNEFTELWYQITNLNTKIEGVKKYYNENTTIYNSLVSKFPSNIVAKTTRFKEKKYFDGKDMYDKNIKDFKI